MIALAKVCAAAFGTNTFANGLPCTPTTPAGMTLQIGAGEIYQMEPIEATACGTLPQNTASSILKQGIQLGTYTTATFAAPGTTGQSINYLIEAQYQDSDISLDPTTGNTSVVLQFYNAANPSLPWSGPNNSGSTSNTFRDGVIAYTVKAGVAATTGTQVTPTPDTGNVGLWVVTVPYGATSLTSANISEYAGAPILPASLLSSIQTGQLQYGIDYGAVNSIQATFPLPPTALIDGQPFFVKIAHTNTGATIFTPNSGALTAYPVVGLGGAALQGGEAPAGGHALFLWNALTTTYTLAYCTGAPLQVGNATQSQHAAPLGQIQAAIQGNLYTSCVAGGTSDALTCSFVPAMNAATLAAGNVEIEVRAMLANATTTPTITLYSGQTPLVIKKGAGLPLAPGDIAGAGHWLALNYDVTLGCVILQNPANGVNIQASAPNFTAAIASNALTGSLGVGSFAFRNAAGGTGGTLSAAVAAALSLVVPSGASLGSVAGVQATFVWALLYNGGSPVLAVTNLAGGLDMSETGTISTTAISSSANANDVWYSTAAVSNSPYRLVGVTQQTEATPGTYATPPSLVQPVFGEAFAALMSAGYSQNWVSYSRAPNTTYYNAANKIRWICPVIAGTASGTGTATVFVWNAQAGVYVQAACLSTFGGSSLCGFPIPVPPGASYYLGTITGSAVYSSWTEMA